MKYFICGLLLIHFAAFGQLKTIPDQVVDINNRPIELASINLVGKNISATTDDLGFFYLKLSNEIHKGDIITLRISKEGYQTTTRQVPVSYLSTLIKLLKSKVKSTSVATTKVKEDAPQQHNYSGITNSPVTSYFQSGGITANQVNFASPPRTLNSEIKNQLLTNLPNKEEKISITSVMGDAEAFQYANETADFLKANGYKNIDGVNQGVFSIPIFGQYITRDSTGVKLTIGARKQ